MRKLWVLPLFFFIIVSLVGTAKGEMIIMSITPDQSIIPNYSYELAETSFTLNVSNTGADSICNVLLYLYDFGGNESPEKANYTVVSVENKQGWIINYNSTYINWTAINNTYCITNSEQFNFYAKANEVDSNVRDNWDVTYNNYLGITWDLYVSILNDILAPRILDYSPKTGDFVKNGSTTNFTIIINESESGLKEVWLFYDYTNVYGSSSSLTFNRSISCDSSIGLINCSENLSLTIQPTDKKYLNFKYVAIDNAGNEVIGSDMWIRIDAEKPQIKLIEPLNNTIVQNSVNFNFSVDDDSFYNNCTNGNCSGLNPKLYCNLTLNGQVYNSSTFNASGNYSFINDLPDGIYQWEIICIDVAGWQSESETRLFVIDTHEPNVTLIEPINGSFNKNNVLLKWNATDNLDNNLICNLTIYNQISHSQTSTYIINGSGLMNLTLNLSDGIYLWNVSCKDWANNTGNSQTWEFIVDTIAPNITIYNPLNQTYSTNLIDLNYTVTDNRAIDSCWYSLDEGLTNISLNCINITLNLGEGQQHLIVYANDSVGNIGYSEVWFFINGSSPEINLTSPQNGANFTINTQIRFEFNVSDDFSNVLLCRLVINSDEKASKIVNVNGINGTNDYFDYSFNSTGNYEWGIECEDKAGNIGISEKRNITIYNIQTGGSGRGSGGGGGSRICEERWVCEEWSECIDGKQTRICRDINRCGTNKSMPLTEIKCNINQSNQTLNQSEEFENKTEEKSEGKGEEEGEGRKESKNFITGGIIGTFEKRPILAGLIIAGIILIGFVILKLKKFINERDIAREKIEKALNENRINQNINQNINQKRYTERRYIDNIKKYKSYFSDSNFSNYSVKDAFKKFDEFQI